MLVIEVSLYVLAGIFCIGGCVLYWEYRKVSKSGHPVIAKVTHVDSKGKGAFTKYIADVSYKIDKKKYKSRVESRFYQPILKNSEIQLQYNALKPTDVIVVSNGVFRVFMVIGLIFLLAANFISVI